MSGGSSSFLSPWTKRLIVFPVAINTRWGPARLRAACERDLGIELDRSTAVLFHNRAKDTLVLYSLDADGDRSITKKLDRGGFLLPVPASNQKFVVLDAARSARSSALDLRFRAAPRDCSVGSSSAS